MIDIHSHILPFVDDGSASLEDSLKLLKIQEKAGVDKIFLTPHRKANKYSCPSNVVIEEFEKFSTIAKKNGYKGELYLGREIFYDENTLDLLDSSEFITMNGTKCVLIEFSSFTSTNIQDCVFNIVKKGFIPIIAHVERYVYLDWHDLFDLRCLGALIQINSSCIIGQMGSKIKEQVMSAISEGLIDFVASDLHFGRKTYMKKAYNVIKSKIGKVVAEDLFVNNAMDFLINKNNPLQKA